MTDREFECRRIHLLEQFQGGLTAVFEQMARELADLMIDRAGDLGRESKATRRMVLGLGHDMDKALEEVIHEGMRR